MFVICNIQCDFSCLDTTQNTYVGHKESSRILTIHRHSKREKGPQPAFVKQPLVPRLWDFLTPWVLSWQNMMPQHPSNLLKSLQLV